MFSRIKYQCIIAAISLCLPMKAHAVELGLTPSHVYGLWLNINKSYVALQRAIISDDAFLIKLEKIPVKKFTNKKPADVYKYASRLQLKISEEFNLGRLPPFPEWVEDFDKLTSVETGKVVTPSEVFLLSSWFLNQLTQEYVSYTNGEMKVSHFYENYGLSGKTPNDVFGLVDLLNKRQMAVKAYRQNQQGSN